MPGGLKNIIVVESLPLRSKIASRVPDTIQVQDRWHQEKNKTFWFANDIYLKWPVSISTITNAITKKHSLLAKLQQAVRKDIDRAFGVLQEK